MCEVERDRTYENTCYYVRHNIYKKGGGTDNEPFGTISLYNNNYHLKGHISGGLMKKVVIKEPRYAHAAKMTDSFLIN